MSLRPDYMYNLVGAVVKQDVKMTESRNQEREEEAVCTLPYAARNSRDLPSIEIALAGG